MHAHEGAHVHARSQTTHPPAHIFGTQAPHLSAWINCLRAGLNAILAWISVTLMAVTFSVSWIPDDASGSHSHFTWTPWRTRQIWTMVGGAMAFDGHLGAWQTHPFAFL